MKIEVRFVTRSPMNPDQWLLGLACGHDTWVTCKTKPTRKMQHCDDCATDARQQKEPGMDYRCGRFETDDRGQRYEITFFDPQSKKRIVFGWSEDRAGADMMCDSIHKHPTMRDPKVRDRENMKTVEK